LAELATIDATLRGASASRTDDAGFVGTEQPTSGACAAQGGDGGQEGGLWRHRANIWQETISGSAGS